MRQARRTGTPTHHGNPVRLRRRQIRTSANRTVCVAACRSTVGPGALSARGRGSRSSAAFTHSSRMPGTQGLGRGPVRGPGRRIIPAPRVPSVRSPVLSVQLARAQPRRVPLVMRRSSVRFRNGGSTEVFTFQWGLFSRLGLIFWCAACAGRGCRRVVAVSVRLMAFRVSGVVSGHAAAACGCLAVLVAGLSRRAGWSWLGRGGPAAGWRGSCGAVSGFWGEPCGGAAGVFLLPGVPCGEDALVADDEQEPW